MLDTAVTFTVGEILTWVLIVVAIIAVIYIIVMVSKVTRIAKPAEDAVIKVNAILDDVKVITENAKEGTEDAAKALHSASRSLHEVSHAIEVNMGPIAAVSGLIGAGTHLARLVAPSEKKSARKKDTKKGITNKK